MAKKSPEFKLNFYTNGNGCWASSAYLVDRTNRKTYTISVAAAPGEKARSARVFIKEELEKCVAEFIEAHPTFERVEEDVQEQCYWDFRK